MGFTQNIATASHAHDGDLKHLREAVEAVGKIGGGEVGALLKQGRTLYSRLDAEVGRGNRNRSGGGPWAGRAS